MPIASHNYTHTPESPPPEAFATWRDFAAAHMPDRPQGLPFAELIAFRDRTCAIREHLLHEVRGHLGRNHPELEDARKAIEDRAITLTAPINLAEMDRRRPEREATRAAMLEQEENAQRLNAASTTTAQRVPLSGARPYHKGAIFDGPAITLPKANIPHLYRQKAITLFGELFAITKDGRKQGLGKQSSQTVFRWLLNFFMNGKTGACYPSYEAIANRSGLGRSTVAEAISSLCDLGFLDRTNRIKRAPLVVRGSVVGMRAVQTSNFYRLGSANMLMIGATVPKHLLEAVIAWFAKWRRFLAELATLLKRLSESRTQTETDSSYNLLPTTQENPSTKDPRERSRHPFERPGHALGLVA